MLRWFVPTAVLLTLTTPAWAGPPYISDDPEPTEYEHFEIYTFDIGTRTQGGTSGAAGIDFNYGAAPDLQLTAVLPVAYDRPTVGSDATGVGNVELGAKYRILRQGDFGWDISIFPRVFLPSGSHDIGERHAAFLLPIWLQKDWGKWSIFGGGGCTLNRGGYSQDFCSMGWVLARQIWSNLQLGAEIYHQTPDTKGGRPTTGLGAGLRYDANENFHLLGYFGPGIQNAAETNRYSWYSSMLFTF